ncbi:MAG: CvpA family protein [Clostridiales bacterium]|nr:CvpA family protein [Clostridiales bacterium]
MMEIISQHWLSIVVGVFLLSMTLYGHYRGFVHIALTLSALVISLAAVRFTMPYATAFLKENTGITQTIEGMLMNAAGADEAEEAQEEEEDEWIEQLKLPSQLKDLLQENNNQEIYELLGVDSFFDFIGAYLADMVLKAVAAVILFILIYFLLRCLIHWLDLLTMLPVLSGINQIAGAILGAVQGLLWLWMACLVIGLFSQTDWATVVMGQIEGSAWLSFLYKNNLINWVFLGILRAIG